MVKWIQNHSVILRVVAFVMILFLMIIAANKISQPILLDWNNYSTIDGFYEQPENTIETIFVGTSRAMCAFSPMELYRDYGISSYVLATASQPLEASYYWTVEAYRCHPKTLKTVILECTKVRGYFDLGSYQRAIDTMRYPTKLKAVLSSPIEKSQKFYYLSPLMEYHSRWLSLGKADFTEYRYRPQEETRGYLYFDTVRANTTNYKSFELPLAYIDPDAKPAKFEEDSLESLAKIVDFCKDKQLNLVLVTTPNSWSSSEHNAVSRFAEEKKVPYIDFNAEPMKSEIQCNYALDMVDGTHSNYYNAKKITSWMGNYLVENGAATDVRGDPKYAFMKEQMEAYDAEVTDAIALKETKNLCDYLSIALRKDDVTTFITVKGTASSCLNQDMRNQLDEMGFHGLKDLKYGQPYIAVIDGGFVTEQTANVAIENKQIRDDGAIIFSGRLQNNHTYNLISGGKRSGSTSSCIIDGSEYSTNANGINIVVYDCDKGENQTGSVVDTAVFDTGVSETRQAGYLQDVLNKELAKGTPFAELSTNLQNLYRYNYRCMRSSEAEKLKLDTSGQKIQRYLNAYWNKPNAVLYLFIHRDSPIHADPEIFLALEKYGLKKIKNLNHSDSYIAVVDEGEVIEEKKGKEAVSITYGKVSVVSSRAKAEKNSSVSIDGNEYATNLKGMNLVVYDKFLDMVIDTANFPIFQYSQRNTLNNSVGMEYRYEL